VRPAVAVRVYEQNAETPPALFRLQLVGDIRERAIAVVAIERVRQWLEPAWLAHVAGFAVVRAIRWVVGLKSPVAIVRHVNLREPVAVKVPPAGAGGPQSVVETRFTSDIDKVPAAIAVGLVVEQDEPVVPGQEQVGPTVVVVVERGDPVRILERAGQPDFRA